MVQAIPEAILHHQAFEAFTHGLKSEHSDQLVEWERKVRIWEANKSKNKDPYLIEEEVVSVHKIECQLADEDRRQSTTVSNIVTPSAFIISGLALEGTQLVLHAEAATRDKTAAQISTLQRKRNALCQKIRKFHDAQVAYIPGLPAIDYVSLSAEQIPLHLPSALSPDQRLHAPELVSIEDRLREAHASQALADIRRHLRLRTLTLRFKDENATSQGAYTRMRALLDQIEAKVRAARARYDAAREAMLSLRGHGAWEETYKLLKTEDLRGVNEHVVLAKENEASRRAEAVADGSSAILQTMSTIHLRTGDGHRMASWIWYNITGDETQDSSLNDGIWLEWLKARARDRRWREELILLEEEMRRVLQYTEWKAFWWAERASQCAMDSSSQAEGMVAYALEQAAMERCRSNIWHARWEP
ncbi:hypothetical protein H0H92_010437, partial [Tricholoma furcatifolium]